MTITILKKKLNISIILEDPQNILESQTNNMLLVSLKTISHILFQVQNLGDGKMLKITLL